jgi:hypothetical protein
MHAPKNHGQRESDLGEAKLRNAIEDVANQAHHISVVWCNLRCDHPYMLLPIKFVEEMMELDLRVDRLGAMRNEREKQ